MFKALDRVDYDSLRLNKRKDGGKAKSRCIKTLVDIASVALNWHVDLKHLTEALPTHLLPQILRIAVLNDQEDAIRSIVAGWPLHTLRFKDITEEDDDDCVTEKIGKSTTYVMEGLTHRTKSCRLQCIDFQGIGLHQHYSVDISITWPLRSLRKAQLKLKNLTKVIDKTLADKGVSNDKLNNLLNTKIELLAFKNKIIVPKGQRLEVKLDSVTISTCNTLTLDYLLTNCLRSVTPLFVTAKNICFKSEMEDNCVSGFVFSCTADMEEKLVPDYLPSLLKIQDAELLNGLSLRQLEEGMFYQNAKDIQNFTNLRSLELQNCDIYLQEGITRSRTLARSHLSQTFSSFKHLRRLDLSFNYLLGCLGEMLDELSGPLEYLSLRGCDLNEKDLLCLAESKHSPHLRELNLSKLCQFSIYENDGISHSYLMSMMKHFPRLTVLNLSQNHLPDSGISEFCAILANDLTALKGLNVAGNYLQFENQLKLTRACAKNSAMQWIRFTCTSDMFIDEGNLNVLNMEQMIARFQNLLVQLGREDICVDVVRLSFAILVDLIDVFD